jgi:hypothetical protein
LFKRNTRVRKRLKRRITAKALWQTSLIIGAIVGLSSPTFADTRVDSESKFEIVSTSIDDALTQRFCRKPSGGFLNSLNQPFERSERQQFEWAGADAAYSVPIGTNKTLWLFGDTFLRPQGDKAEGEAKSSLRMINNSVAIQKIRDEITVESKIGRPHFDFPPNSLEFCWGGTQNNDNSFFEDANATKLGHWLWPLDGIYRHGKLYEFVNEICKSQNAVPAFGFATSNQLLLKVDNIEESADKWKMTFSTIEAPDLQVGNAVTHDEQFAYVYCSYLPAREGMNQHPQIVIRLPLDSLDKIDARDLFKTTEVWSRVLHNKNQIERRWIKSSEAQPEIIMQDGAPEFSVSQVKGLEGYFAVYFPSGFGTKIMLRHAPRPEGPWSEPQCIYDCPVDAERFFVYSAKSHPELCTKNEELCVTYCQNIKSSDLTSLEPEKFYFPHAIKVQIKKSLHVPN